MRSWYIVKVLGNGPVDALCVILEMYLMLKRHLTDLALEPIPFFDISQMLPLEVLRQVSRISRTGKLVGALFKRQALLP
jgi:hypothetical protein